MKKFKSLKKWQRYGIIGGLAAAILYMVFRPKIDSFIMSKAGLLEEDSDKINPDITLKKGKRGASVAELQRRLNTTGEALAEDGIFGDLTETALVNSKGVKEIKLSQWLTIEYAGDPIDMANDILNGAPTKEILMSQQ